MIISEVSTDYPQRPSHHGRTVSVEIWNDEYLLLRIKSDGRGSEAIISLDELRELVDAADMGKRAQGTAEEIVGVDRNLNHLRAGDLVLIEGTSHLVRVVGRDYGDLVKVRWEDDGEFDSIIADRLIKQDDE